MPFLLSKADGTFLFHEDPCGEGLYHVVPTHITKIIIRTAQAHVSWTSEVLFPTTIACNANVVLGRALFSLTSLFRFLGDVCPRS